MNQKNRRNYSTVWNTAKRVAVSGTVRERKVLPVTTNDVNNQ